MLESSMWAAQFARYGPPQVLAIAETQRPRPGNGQTLLRVIATSFNRA